MGDNSSNLWLVFETHATSLDNEAGLASGWFDVALSATGEAQARDLGVRRAHDDLEAVFCSDLARAVRTADIAFGDRGLPIVRDTRLRECDYGQLTRRTTSEIESRRIEHVAKPFPGGESYAQVCERVSSWLTEAARTYADRKLLVIGHRATFYALQHLVLHVQLEAAVRGPWQWQPGWEFRVTPDFRC
jgi:2,3-bisphosphoglycerate-dependent phosphoglycerate mutase